MIAARSSVKVWQDLGWMIAATLPCFVVQYGLCDVSWANEHHALLAKVDRLVRVYWGLRQASQWEADRAMSSGLGPPRRDRMASTARRDRARCRCT